MNRPFCLIGDIESAKEYINKYYPEVDYEFLILSNDISIEDLKRFRFFLEEPSINIKVGVIYSFSTLSASKQSILLKIFEDLPEKVMVILHSFYNVEFVIHTRCNVVYLKNNILQRDIVLLNSMFLDAMKSKTLDQNMMNGIEVFFSTLNFYNLNFLTKQEKDCIIESLK